RTRYGFEKIHRSGGLLGGLIDMASRSPTLWQVTRPSAATEPKDLELYGKVQRRVPGVAVKSLGWTLATMRAKHDDAELAIMQHGIRITEEGFRAAWQV
ncbi:MAG: hypothetical protein WKG03_05925, partial [Telluria sp.]